MSDKTIRDKTIEEALEKSAKAICAGCGYLDGYECTYNGANCGVSKPMLESVTKTLVQMKKDPADEFFNFDSPVVNVDRKSYNRAIEEFAKALTDKIEVKYCRGDLTKQYIGMQTCEWIKEIAEQMIEEAGK